MKSYPFDSTKNAHALTRSHLSHQVNSLSFHHAFVHSRLTLSRSSLALPFIRSTQSHTPPFAVSPQPTHAHPHVGGLQGQDEAVSGKQGTVGGQEVDVGEVRQAGVSLNARQQLGGVRGGGELVAVLGKQGRT